MKKKTFFPREPKGTLAEQIKNLSEEELWEMLEPVANLFKTKPDKHQLASIAISLDQPEWLFAIDMGGGKTKIAIDTFSIRKKLGDVQRCLVVTTTTAALHWKDEVAKHSDDTATIVDTGKTPTAKAALFMSAETDFVVVSHPWLTRYLSGVTKKGKRFAEKVEERCDRFDMIIIDEVHKVSNQAGVGFNTYVNFFSGIEYRYFLTGTPVGNNYLNLFGIYYLLDYGETFGDSYEKYLSRWFNLFIAEKKAHQSFGIYTLRKDRKEAFFKRFWTKAVRWEESELNNLPEKGYLLLPVQMNVVQAVEYRAAITRKVEFGDDVREELIRITGGVTEKQLAGRQIPAKIAALYELVEKIVIEDGGRLIVWHHLNKEGELIVTSLKKKFKIRIGEARKGISRTKQQQYYGAWKKGAIDVLVANPQSWGEGLDLYEANYDVFYSNGPSLIFRRQAEKRTHRRGQEKPCLHIDLVCSGSIDELNLDNLQKAQDGFLALTRDKLEERFKRRGE